MVIDLKEPIVLLIEISENIVETDHLLLILDPIKMHYYKIGIEPIDYIESNKMNFCEGNIVKYVTRYKEKDGIADLKKAQYYLEKLIDSFEK